MISRLFLFCALLGSVALTSCDTEGLAINKDYSGATIELAVPASADAGAVAITKEGVETKLRESLEDFDISEDRLQAVGVKDVVARINDPSGEFSFANLTNVTLMFHSDELGDIEIASMPNADGTEATFVVADSELKEFLLSDKFDAVLTGESDRGVPEGVIAEVDVTYEITAGL
ncbi:MAG: hypothetical protein AB8F78_12340 [Saprospiraceae bacterium]